MATILIAGGTGLIGKRLSQYLVNAGHSVRHLSRKAQPNAPIPTYAWDPSTGQIDTLALEGVEIIINLAGAGIADKPWTKARKEVITSSRVQSALLLRDAILKMKTDRPALYISSAAIGYYGDRQSEWMTEESKPGIGFLTESCVAWENAIQEVAQTGIRTVALRIGIVLSKQGGVLPKLLLPTQFGVAPYFGQGQQWYSWIHIDDLCSMFLYAIENKSITGTYNACAPQPVTNKEFMECIVRATKRAALVFPAPAFLLRLGMGEMADTVLYSTRVNVDKIQHNGFSFRYPYLEQALKSLLFQHDN